MIGDINMKRSKTLKKIWSIFLTLAMVLTISVTALPSYAAGGNINIVYNPQIAGLTSTPYTLYRVATFKYDEETKKSYIALDKSFVGEGIPDLNAITAPKDTTNIDSPEYVAWEKEWLDAAASLANYIATHPEAAKTKVAEGDLQVRAGAQPIKTVSENGIYLLVGEKQRVDDTYWWPVPVLFMVLNGDTTFSIASQNGQGQDMRYNEAKVMSKPFIYKHTVTKFWDSQSPEETRCDVRVGIFYGEGESLVDVDTVTLKYDKEHVQSYTWYSTEKANGDKITVDYYTEDPGKSGVTPKKSFDVDKSSTWLVREMRETADERDALKYYESKIMYSADGTRESETSRWSADTSSQEAISVTNTFKKAKLVINKNLQSYLDQSVANAMVVFEVTGKVKGPKEPGSTEIEEKTAYHNKVSIPFKGPGTKSITLDIPVNLDSLEVKEIYATNYRVDPERTEKVDVDLTKGVTVDGVTTYTANFKNVYDNKIIYSKGIVNNYENSGDGFKIVTRDDGTVKQQ